VHSRPSLFYSWAVYARDIIPFLKENLLLQMKQRFTDTTSGIQLGDWFASSIIKTVMCMADLEVETIALQPYHLQ